MGDFNKNKYNTEYSETHYDRFTLRLPLGDKDRLKNIAAAEGLTLNAYIIQAVQAYQAGNKENK